MAGARSAGRMPFMSASPLNRRSAALYGAELTQPGYQQRIAESHSFSSAANHTYHLEWQGLLRLSQISKIPFRVAARRPLLCSDSDRYKTPDRGRGAHKTRKLLRVPRDKRGSYKS